MVVESVVATNTSTAAVRRASPRHGVPEPAGKLLLSGLLATLFWPALRWLGHLIGSPDFRLNTYLMLGVVALLVLRWRRERPAIAPGRSAVLRRGPLLLFVSAELLFLIGARLLDANLLSTLCAACAAYAALGMYVSPVAWRRGVPGLLLLLAVLPFGEIADTYLGMPARRLTAQFVEHMLGAAHIASVPAETVLVLEGGLVYIDAPCAGVRSLWSGLVFFAGVTWVERVALNATWALRGLLLLALLVAANMLRVLAIVLIGPVAGFDRLAQIVHEPLGILGFALACGVVFLSLRTRGAGTARVAEERPDDPKTHRALAVPVVAALAVAGIALYTPRPRPPPLAAPRFALIGAPIELSDAERGLFARVGDTQADKRRFVWNGVPGTLLAVYSRSWRAHHAPEVCLASAGHRVETLQTWSIDARSELRVAALDGGARTALYWYQSDRRTTAELLTRTLASLTGDEAEWVMVSILVDGAWSVGDPRALQLYRLLRASVSDALDRNTRGPS